MKMASRLMDLMSNKTNMHVQHAFLSFPCRCFARLQRCFVPVRACLHEGGGPQIGVLTCGGSPHLSCERDQIKMRDYVDRRVTHQSGLPYRPGVPHPPCKQARKRQTSQLHIIFIEKLSYMCLPNILFRVIMFAFIFHCRQDYFHFAGRQHFSFSHRRFVFLRNSFPLFLITRSSSFFVIHVSVNIKNNDEKYTTLLFFSF